MQPYSQNIIFLDTEFSTLNPYEGEILSVGLIKMNGEEWYAELEYSEAECEEWVREHVLPKLKGKKISREEAKKQFTEFIGDSKPYIISYVVHYDSIYLHKLFWPEKCPFHWIPLDFASFLFAYGINPEDFHYQDKKTQFLKELGLDLRDYETHNALGDARLLRNTYLRLLEKKE